MEASDLLHRIAGHLERIPLAFVTLDRDFRLTFINRRAEQMMRLPREQLLGKVVWQEWPETADTLFETEVRRAMSGGIAVDFEERHPAHGSWTEVHAYPTDDGLGLYFRDVTVLRQDEQRLREAETRFRTLVEQLPAVTYIVAVGGPAVPVYFSPQYEHLLGYTAEERMGDRHMWERLLHPEDRERALAESDRTAATGEPFRMEYRMIARDGRTVWVHDEAVLVRDEEGNPICWQGVLFDITERKLAEDEQRRRDHVLEAVAAAADRFLRADSWEAVIQDAIAHLGRAARASRVYVFENGTDGGTLLRRRRAEWCAPGVPPGTDDPEGCGAPYGADGLGRWQQMLERGLPVRGRVRTFPAVEREALAANGVRSILVLPVLVDRSWWGFVGFDDCADERTWPDAHVDALKVAADALGGAIGREIAETALRQTEAKYRTLVEGVPAITYIDAADEESSNLYTSPQIEEILGFSPEEWIADPELWIRQLHPDDRERVVEEHLRSNATGDPFRIEYRMIARDGRDVWLRDDAVLVHDERGRPQYWQGVVFDISERKELKRALELEREVGRRLRDLDEMKNAFLAAVSHELRTPLAEVMGIAITLERNETNLDRSVRQEFLRGLVRGARRLDGLLSDLLDLNRLVRGTLRVDLRPTDVGALVRRVVEGYQPIAQRTVHLEAPSFVAAVDETSVQRIIESLLSNVARHTPTGAPVWVRVTAIEDGVLVAVEDAGPGVPEHLRQEVFEPFRRGADAPSHAPGVGVGLSLVGRLAELHGGRAWVEERPGGGAAFRVFLTAGDRVPDHLRHDEGARHPLESGDGRPLAAWPS